MRLGMLSCLLAVLVIAPYAGGARAPNRRALLIANSAYEHLPRLDAPRPNVDALADALSKVRFQPQVVYDLPQPELISAIRRFTETVQPGDFVLIYYSGYGYQADDLNYILPIGFDPKDMSAPGLSAFSVRNLQRKIEQRKAGTSMLVFDASRPGPGLPNGLAAMLPASHTLISFSDAPNQAVPDPPGSMVDLFTGTLIQAIVEPGSKPAGVLTRTRSDVSRATSGKQVPHVIESPVPDFAFTPPVAAVPPGNPGVTIPTPTKTNPPAVSTPPTIPTTPPVSTMPPLSTTQSTPMWPMDGGDPRRSGYAPYRGPRQARILWSVEAGNRDQNSPLIGPDGRIYVWSTGARTLRSVDGDGRILWSVPLPLSDQVGFSADGLVMLTSFTGRTRTLDSDGKPIREGTAAARYQGLFMWQGHAYNSNGITPAGTTLTSWYFFRADDRDSWQVPVDGKAIWPSIDQNGVLYVGTNNGTLYAVSNAATVLWSIATKAGPTRGLAVTSGRDLLAAIGPSLVDARDGSVRWTFQSGDGNTLAPIHDQTGTIYFAKGTDFWAVSAAGREVWRLRMGDALTTAPAMDRSGRIFVASGTKLYCIGE